MRRIRDEPAKGAVPSGAGLADGDLSLTWADTARGLRAGPLSVDAHGIPGYYGAVELTCRDLSAQQAQARSVAIHTSIHGPVRPTPVWGAEFRQNSERSDVPICRAHLARTSG